MTQHSMSTALVWFRQDLRLSDNPAFFEACTQHDRVIPLYLLDEKNSTLGAAQSWWLHHSLQALKESLLKKFRLDLVLRQGDPTPILIDLIKTFSIDGIYWNRCYEPLTIERDKNIKKVIQDLGISVQSFNASLFHEPWTIFNKNHEFFKVFTPYWKTCRQTLFPKPIHEIKKHPVGVEILSDNLEAWDLLPKIDWAASFASVWKPGEIGAEERLETFIDHALKDYQFNRDIPEKEATSYLSPHLHFGEISPWTILRAIEQAKLDTHCDLASAERFLSELGWREFSYYLLYHVPNLPFENFKQEYNTFPWQNDESLLYAWQKGMTGYPIVDAGMRELWATGYMHNRVRMIVASFLTKDLLIDWRLGAHWFLDTLVDADLANNSASWQWVAGCGADAAPYFRIFNPVLQSQKFDPQGRYICRWIPELATLDKDSIHAPWESHHANAIYHDIHYPKPIVDHHECRTRALKLYAELKKGKQP